MNPSNRTLIILVVAALLIIAGIAYLLSEPGSPSTSTPPVTTSLSATTTMATSSAPSSATTTPTTADPLPVDAADHLVSWSLGTPSAAATAQANSDLASLRADFGKGEYSDYSLYVGMGLDYELLGEGQSAYNAFVTAAENTPSLGLAYVDIGNLMGELGAYHTAADAFQKALTVQPQIEQYELSYLQFLSTYTPHASGVQAAFTGAVLNFPNDVPILSEEAQWYAAVGQTPEAIAEWQKILPLVATSSQAAIQAEIAHLQAQ